MWVLVWDATGACLNRCSAACAGHTAHRHTSACRPGRTDTPAGARRHLNPVLRTVLETMFRARQFQRVVLCLRDPAHNRLTGRFGLGGRAVVLRPLFQLPLQGAAGQTPDLISGVCLHGLDTLIADRRQPGVAQRLPGWYRQQVAVPSFFGAADAAEKRHLCADLRRPCSARWPAGGCA